MALTIAAPPHTMYGGGNDANALITDENGIQGEAKVSYYKANEAGTDKTGDKLTGAPTDAGKYWAEITLGTDGNSATAHVVYAVAKADPTANAPTGLTATYGQTLADVSLEGKNPEGNTDGAWAWVDSARGVGDVVTPAATFKANFTPTDAANYNSVSNVDVPVTVNKAANPATVASTASVKRGGNTVNLANGVTMNGATGDVTYSFADGNQGCELSGSVLTSGDATGTVTVNVTAAAMAASGLATLAGGAALGTRARRRGKRLHD